MDEQQLEDDVDDEYERSLGSEDYQNRDASIAPSK
jgi:hypothetical protein